jgi:hypothetical protein
LGWQISILAKGWGPEAFAHDFMFRLAAVEFGALTAQNLGGETLQSHIVVMQDPSTADTAKAWTLSAAKRKTSLRF